MDDLQSSMSFLLFSQDYELVLSKLQNMITTAYCICTICCGPHATGLTASGKRPQQGITVAAPRSIPLGTTIYISNRPFIVQDRLARRYDNRIDVFFNKHADAKAFGKQNLHVSLVLTKNHTSK